MPCRPGNRRHGILIHRPQVGLIPGPAVKGRDIIPAIRVEGRDVQPIRTSHTPEIDGHTVGPVPAKVTGQQKVGTAELPGSRFRIVAQEIGEVPRRLQNPARLSRGSSGPRSRSAAR